MTIRWLLLSISLQHGGPTKPSFRKDIIIWENSNLIISYFPPRNEGCRFNQVIIQFLWSRHKQIWYWWQIVGSWRKSHVLQWADVLIVLFMLFCQRGKGQLLQHDAVCTTRSRNCGTGKSQAKRWGYVNSYVGLMPPPPGGGTPRKIWQGCAARFLKPLPYLWTKSAIFSTLFMTWFLDN